MARRTSIQPKDTHWPPAGVRDIRPDDPMNAGPLTIRLGNQFAAAFAKMKAKQGASQ
jgi:hypothetical protein